MKLNAQHHKAITQLAEGLNNKEVAEILNIAPETVSRWRADIEFKAALNGLIQANYKSTQDKLRHLSSVAVQTLEDVMTDKETPAITRATASLKILELTKIKTRMIGSTNPKVLREREKEDEFMTSLFQ